jgi:hypothetical protein
MKLRIIQKPSLTCHPDIHWYHAQVKRFGFWVDCRDDLVMPFVYSSQMLAQSYDLDLDVVQNFVNHVMRKEEMFPQSRNTVIAEYET